MELPAALDRSHPHMDRPILGSNSLPKLSSGVTIGLIIFTGLFPPTKQGQFDMTTYVLLKMMLQPLKGLNVGYQRDSFQWAALVATGHQVRSKIVIIVV